MNRRWWGRVAVGVVAFAAVEVVAVLIGAETDELRLALLVALVVGAAALLLDAAVTAPAVWNLHAERESGLGRLDPRTAAYLRILENHLSAREADVALRGRLRELADQRLRTRHDLSLEDPRAEALLGAELLEVVTGRPRRLDPDEIDRCVTRIEEL